MRWSSIAPLEVFCKNIVDISYENASFLQCLLPVWLLLIYFLTTIIFWFVKCLCDWCEDLNQLFGCVVLSLKTGIMENYWHCNNSIQLIYNWQIKWSKNFQNHAVLGLLLKNCSGDEVAKNDSVTSSKLF